MVSAVIREKNAYIPLKAQVEFLVCLETARLIAMRFRFEAGSRQHLENESLGQTKKLLSYPDFRRFCVCLKYCTSFLLLVIFLRHVSQN